jgi:hypothetical protein
VRRPLRPGVIDSAQLVERGLWPNRNESRVCPRLGQRPRPTQSVVRRTLNHTRAVPCGLTCVDSRLCSAADTRSRRESPGYRSAREREGHGSCQAGSPVISRVSGHWVRDSFTSLPGYCISPARLPLWADWPLSGFWYHRARRMHPLGRLPDTWASSPSPRFATIAG